MCEMRFYADPDREMQAVAASFARYASHFSAFHSTLSMTASEYKFLSASHFDDEHNFKIRIAGDLIRVKLSILKLDAQRMVGAITALQENTSCRTIRLLMDEGGHLLNAADFTPIQHQGTSVEVSSDYVVNNFILNCIECNEA